MFVYIIFFLFAIFKLNDVVLNRFSHVQMLVYKEPLEEEDESHGSMPYKLDKFPKIIISIIDEEFHKV